MGTGIMLRGVFAVFIIAATLMNSASALVAETNPIRFFAGNRFAKLPYIRALRKKQTE